MGGVVQTGCFVMAAVGAFYLLTKRDEVYGRTFVRAGVIVGVIAACVQLFPTGDMQGKQIAENQPVTLAAMEGLFETQQGAPLVIVGQPDVPKRRLDNPLEVPKVLSFLTYQQWSANVKGLDSFPQELWPDRIALLYYSYHVMLGRGTIFIAVMVVAAFLLWRRTLYESRWMLWLLMICVPMPYIEHGRVDHGGARAAALADLRIDAHGARSVSPRRRGQCLVHVDWIHGNVRSAGDFVLVLGLAGGRNRAGATLIPRRRRGACPGALRGRRGVHLVFARCADAGLVRAAGRLCSWRGRDSPFCCEDGRRAQAGAGEHCSGLGGVWRWAGGH